MRERITAAIDRRKEEARRAALDTEATHIGGHRTRLEALRQRAQEAMQRRREAATTGTGEAASTAESKG